MKHLMIINTNAVCVIIRCIKLNSNRYITAIICFIAVFISILLASTFQLSASESDIWTEKDPEITVGSAWIETDNSYFVKAYYTFEGSINESYNLETTKYYYRTILQFYNSTGHLIFETTNFDRIKRVCGFSFLTNNSPDSILYLNWGTNTHTFCKLSNSNELVVIFSTDDYNAEHISFLDCNHDGYYDLVLEISGFLNQTSDSFTYSSIQLLGKDYCIQDILNKADSINQNGMIVVDIANNSIEYTEVIL